MNLISKEQIERSKGDRAIIEATWKQVQKDFQLFDETINIPEESTDPYHQLFSQIQPIVDRMLNLDAGRFFPLLYAIDVNEVRVKQLVLGGGKSDPSIELTQLIIERELLKVVLRKHFS